MEQAIIKPRRAQPHRSNAIVEKHAQAATRNRAQGAAKRVMKALAHQGEGFVPLAIVVEDGAPPGKPRTRGECAEGIRPCPYVSCRYHLFLDVDERNGDLKLNFPVLDPDQLIDTCALDVAERTDGATLEEISVRMNVTRERVRQIERRALFKVFRSGILEADA